MKKILLLLLAVTPIGIITALPAPAQAATWHSTAIPHKLRGHWVARDNHGQGVHIYKHKIHYTGEKAVKVKWRYAGNRKYHFKYAHSQGFTINLHYYGRHKITINSYWHSYYR